MNAVLSALRGTGPALAAPVVFGLAARLEQVDLEEMLSDAATAAFVLRSAQALFGLPVVVNHYRLGLEVESPDDPLPRDASGHPVPGEARSGPLSAEAAQLGTAVDVAARLADELRGRAAVLGVLTGPATLAALRGGELTGAAALYAALARRYAEAGVAGVLLAEAPGVPPIEGRDAALAEVTNICRFYNVGSILLGRPGDSSAGPVDQVLPADEAVPPELLKQPPGEQAIGRWRPRRGLLLTAGEVPPDADPESVTAWVDALRGAPLRSGR